MIGRQLQAASDEQISLTDPDACARATGSGHRGVVGYNMRAAVDTKHHIVVANAVTNRGQLNLPKMGTFKKNIITPKFVLKFILIGVFIPSACVYMENTKIYIGAL